MSRQNVSSRARRRDKEEEENLLETWMPILRPAGIVLVLLLVGIWMFSGKKKGPDNIYPVKGEVFHNGQPAEGAIVTFWPARNDSELKIAVANVDKDGVYKLTTYGAFDGAMPGDYRVTVTWNDILGRENMDEILGPDKFDGRYANADGSARLVTVEPTRNTVPRFDL